jgi:hypothetical protein
MSYRRDSYSIFRIKDLLDGSIKTDTTPTLFSKNNVPIGYVKLYGIVTDKTTDDSINQITGHQDYLFKIEDGTGSTWVKTSHPNAIEIKKWDFIRTIGFVALSTSNGKEYEIEVISDVVVKLDDFNWELVHILESQKAKNKFLQSNKKAKKSINNSTKINNDVDSNISKAESKLSIEEIDSEPELESLTSKIEKILREFDSGNGVEFSFILKTIGDKDESEVDDILFELAYEGKVYQPRPDYYKIMD